MAINTTNLQFPYTTTSTTGTTTSDNDGDSVHLIDVHIGKVRDSYILSNGLMLVITTDRQSAFDQVLATVPFKGQVLNYTSSWWMTHTSHIIKNSLVDVIDHNVSVMHRCEVVP